MPPFSPLLETNLHLLVCPVCHSSLVFAQDAVFAQDTVFAQDAPSPPSPSIACTACHRRYPIHDGLPVLIASRATLPE